MLSLLRKTYHILKPINTACFRNIDRVTKLS